MDGMGDGGTATGQGPAAPAGGTGTGSPAGAPPAPPAPTPPASPPAPAAPPAPFAGEFDPARARATIDTQRAENDQLKRQLAELRGQQQPTPPAPAAPPAAPPAGPDSAALAAELDAEKTRAATAASDAREARVALAVHQQAGTKNANAVALTDSLAFRQATKDLDPAAADFADKLGAAIDKALENNPALRARGQVPGASGADTSGRPGGVGNRTRPNLAEAVRAKVGG